MVLSCACSLLCWVEVACSEQYQTCQTVAFCLHTLTLCLASWLCQGAVLSLLQVPQEAIDMYDIMIFMFYLRCVWAPPS